MKKAVESQKPPEIKEPPSGDTTDMQPEADKGAAKTPEKEKSEGGDSVKS